MLVFRTPFARTAAVFAVAYSAMVAQPASAAVAYVADAAGNAVYGFDATSGTLDITIGGLNAPAGLTVDRAGNLWVANYGGHDVLEFARGATSPRLTLADPGENPVDVSICPSGDVYVANGGNNLPGNLAVYAAGATHAMRTLADAQVSAFQFVTCDARGNVYASSDLTNAAGAFGRVEEFAGGRQSGARRLPIYMGYAAGIKLDASGNLLVADLSGETLSAYTSLGQPTGAAIFDFMIDFAPFDDGRNVLIADPFTAAGESVAFPSGTVLHRYTHGLQNVVGAAYDPAANLPQRSFLAPSAVNAMPGQIRFPVPALQSTRPPVSLVPQSRSVRPATAAQRPVSFAANPTSNLAYVSSFGTASVLAYPSQNKNNAGPVCSIPVPVNSVNGIRTDPAGDLWIPIGANSASGRVQEYGPHCGAKGLAIAIGNGQPGDVAFDASGNVYVENVNGAALLGAYVDVFPAGSATLTRVLAEGRASAARGLALDAHGDVFLSWWNYWLQQGYVDEFVHGQNPAVELPMRLGPSVEGIVLDKAGNLIVIDNSGKTLDVFAPPFGPKPTYRIPLQGYTVQCEFGHLGGQLYCADNNAGSIDVYNYNPARPGSSGFAYSWTAGLSPSGGVEGIALAPPAPN